MQENIDLKDGLRLEVESNISENNDDEKFLKSLLIDGIDINEGKDIMKDTFSFSLPGKCLTADEIKSMLAQKKEFKNFKWDNSVLGFDTKNQKTILSFSLPLFSDDKSKAVMMIKFTCPGLCGTGQTILFKKENGVWVKQILEMFYY